MNFMCGSIRTPSSGVTSSRKFARTSTFRFSGARFQSHPRPPKSQHGCRIFTLIRKSCVGLIQTSNGGGTLSTAAGRFPGSNGTQVVERIGNFHHAVWLHVRAVAAFGIVFLVLAGWAWLRRRQWPWLVRGCAALLAILLVQMGIGEWQYRRYGTVQWWVVVAHVFVAALLFAWTVGLVARLWRPVRH